MSSCSGLHSKADKKLADSDAVMDNDDYSDTDSNMVLDDNSHPKDSFEIVKPTPKRKRLSANPDSSSPSPDKAKLTVIISLTESTKNLNKANQVLIARDLHKIAGPLKQIKKRGKTLFIYCHNTKQRNALNGLDHLATIAVKTLRP